MIRDWSNVRAARVSAGGTGPPRIEIGDILRGSGTVFTIVDDRLLITSRACAGTALAGPFGVDAADERRLRSALELEVRDAPAHLDPAALKVVSELLARRADERNGSGPHRPAAAPDRDLSWDEANSDIC